MPADAEPPIREFADRGVLWLLESPRNLEDLVRIVAERVAVRLDFARAEREERTFVPDSLRKQEGDVLFRVPFREGRRAVWIYILLEHQSRPDRTMGLRLLSYMVQVWTKQCRGWEDARTP
jgi:predicted transposase YdaD